MKSRRKLLIALALGGLAVFLHATYLRNQIDQALGPYEPVPVVVATQDILFNQRIEPTMVRVDQVPKQFVQPQALSDPNEVVGSLTSLTVNAGEQVTKTKLSRFEDTHLALRVPEGMRALTLGVSDVSGLNGLVRPGNFVDIFGTFKFKVPTSADRQQGQMQAYRPPQLDTKTYLLFQNILVLAVGSDYRFVDAPFSKDPNDSRNYQTFARNVTLSLRPVEPHKLIHAQDLGSISLVLRSHFDAGREETLLPQTPYTIVNEKEPIHVPDKAPYLDIRGVR